MNVLALGLNHTTAPLDLRGRLAFGPEQVCHALASLRQRLGQSLGGCLRHAAPEAALLSTCNRTELYLVGEAPPAELVPPTLAWLETQGGIDSAQLSAHTYVAHDAAAARHVFRVASGLDSMVLGEPQILGQMKRAVREAETAGTLGRTLHQLFQRSFAVAKEVRTRTEIGSHSVSMAAAAVRLATELFEDFGALRVLFVGAGEMIDLAATHFAARKPHSITLANRRIERAELLAARLGAHTLPLSELPHCLHQFDVVVSCTASALPLIGLGAVERALKARRRRPMLLVDLAVPRDIEPEVARLPDAYLYTVDDLATLVQSAGDKRRAAVAQAEAIVDAGVQGFAHWCEQRHSVPLIQALQQQAEDWSRTEMQRALKRIARGESAEAALQSLASGLAHKMLHGALRELHSSESDQRAAAALAVQRLFLRQGRGEAA
jgi:glutamyl-tRNA reductase